MLGWGDGWSIWDLIFLFGTHPQSYLLRCAFWHLGSTGLRSFFFTPPYMKQWLCPIFHGTFCIPVQCIFPPRDQVGWGLGCLYPIQLWKFKTLFLEVPQHIQIDILGSLIPLKIRRTHPPFEAAEVRVDGGWGISETQKILERETHKRDTFTFRFEQLLAAHSTQSATVAALETP